MTYNVFSGTLNSTQYQSHGSWAYSSTRWKTCCKYGGRSPTWTRCWTVPGAAARTRASIRRRSWRGLRSETRTERPYCCTTTRCRRSPTTPPTT